MKIVHLEHVMLVSHLSVYRTQCLKPLNCRCKHNKKFCSEALLYIFQQWDHCNFIAELQCAKRASEAPWVRKIGNPSSRENLVMTSACDRASERANVRTDLGGRGRGVSRYSSRSPIRETKECHLSFSFFLSRKVRKTHISICHVNKRSETLI